MHDAGILERLEFSPEEDFLRLWDSYRRGSFKIVPGPMERHFEIARRKPASFLDHPPVLGISVGGSNTKLMIAERRNGELLVDTIRAFPNPEEPIPMEVYWDRILFEDTDIRAYLQNEKAPVIGFSIPVPMLKPGVFFHISKVPGILGLIARDLERDAPTHHFGDNMRRYFAARGVASPTLYYYSDTVLAHHGGMSTSKTSPEDKTILLVSGTGLATCDEGNFVLTGQAPILTGDEELYPEAATEGYQYQFVGAGKGIFGVMNRAIRIWAAEAETPLPTEELCSLFSTTAHSRHVYDLWRSTLPGEKPNPIAERIQNLLSLGNYETIVQIAEQIMRRAISCIANSGVLTMAHMGPADSGRGHIFFFEGSITTAGHMLPRIICEMERIISREDLFTGIGLPPPLPPISEAEFFPTTLCTDSTQGCADDLDLSVTGAVTSAAAELLLSRS